MYYHLVSEFTKIKKQIVSTSTRAGVSVYLDDDLCSDISSFLNFDDSIPRNCKFSYWYDSYGMSSLFVDKIDLQVKTVFFQV